MTKFLDLDALTESTEKVVKIKGKEHILKPVTVGQFIENAKIVERLGTNPKFEDEFEAIVKMLLRAFPSMSRVDLEDLPIEHLNAVLEFARDNDGTRASEGEVAAANPQ